MEPCLTGLAFLFRLSTFAFSVLMLITHFMGEK